MPLVTANLLEAAMRLAPVNFDVALMVSARNAPENVPEELVTPPVRVRSLVPVILPGTRMG